MDTNVLIAGLYSSKGASFKIIEAAVLKKLEYAISPLLVPEYLGKVEEKQQQGFLTLPLAYYLKIVRVLIDNGQQECFPVLHRPILPDPGDDKVLECAIAGRCQYILTFNLKDFPAGILNKFQIRTLTPGDFIRQGGW